LIVKFLGTGTSQGIPVVGCKCDTCTSTNPHNRRLRSSVFVEIGDLKILIDTGPDLRQQMLMYQISDVDALLITHEHNDHTAGLDDVRPINFLHNKTLPLYAMQRVIKNIEERFAYIFDENPYPGSPQISLHTVYPNTPFEIKGVEIRPILFQHSTIDILGYIIGNFAYITDASYISDELVNYLNSQALDVITLNALHHKKHHSHFSLSEAVEMAQRIGAKESYLIHMSHTMGRVEEWSQSLPEAVFPAYDGLILTI
jgi:phosphoribosyl 1,2-cyclic phosphate phosphodiesterase